jgi:glutamate 5-kinase
MGNELIVVSAGAISVGTAKMGLPERPQSLRMKQAVAAIGQCRMMHIYDSFFAGYNRSVAQILLTGDDVDDEKCAESLSGTFAVLLEMGVIPIVNENDSVSYKEIESEEKLFGDNDMLSAVVAVLCRADKLIILSDIDGLYDKDPRLYKTANLIKRIEQINEATYSLAGGAGSRRGTGGMRTKLQAADLATAQGIDVIITNGKNPRVLLDITAGQETGTLFVGKKAQF